MRRSLGRCGVESSRMTSSTIKPSLSGSPHTELVDAWALIPGVDPDYDARIEAALRRLPSKTRGKGVAMEGRIPLRVDLCRKCQRGKRVVGRVRCAACLEKRRAQLKNRRATRAASGLCEECGAPSEGRLCEAHRRAARANDARQRERRKERRAVRRRSGRCIVCGQPPKHHGGSFCPTHQDQINAASRRSKAKARLRKVTQALFGDLAALEAMTLFRRVDASPENTP